MTFLSHDQRRAIRTTINTLSSIHEKAERKFIRNEEIDPRVKDHLLRLTNTSETGNQLNALHSMIEQVRTDYLEQLQVMGPRDLAAFAEYMNPDEPPAPHHIWLCERLQDMESSQIMRMTISMPPGHAKSTYASRLFPAWYLGKHPKKKYIQAGHSGTFAENEFGRKTKALVDSDPYRAMFPKIHLASDSRAAGYWSIAQFGGSYLSRGVGQGISGFRANMSGVDDPFASREDAESQTIRDKVWDWFSADFSTRLLPNSPLFAVATRWHSDDLIGRIEEMNKAGLGLPWYIINLPAICVDDDDAMGREIGEPLWKDFFTTAHLMNLKATLPSRDWNSLYMGQPVDAEGGIISASWIQRFEVLPSKSKWKRVTLSVDSAIKDNDRADYTAIGVWIEMDDGSHYLAFVHRDKLELPAMINRIEAIAREWDVGAILIEDKGSGTQYKQLRSGKAPAPVIALSTSNDSKQFRLDGVAPLFEAGKVFIPQKGIWVPDYELELIGFPAAKYDDQVDMTSQYLAWARKKKGGGSKPLHVASSTSVSNNKVIQQIQKSIEEIAARNLEDPINKILAERALQQ